MRKIVERIVLLCMLAVLYFNLTSFPKQHPPREVRGNLERLPNE
jgi:hypothetical protein